jgi:two-component system sensor kinase FixL
LLRIEFQMRQAVLDIVVPRSLPKVHGDRVHLQQVLLNLLLNSLDASDGQAAGQWQVTLRASQMESGMVELAVSDRGEGIQPDRLPHLFEPFFTTKPKGTGIGLVITKTIVELHGGQISAENNPDGGGRFVQPAIDEASTATGQNELSSMVVGSMRGSRSDCTRRRHVDKARHCLRRGRTRVHR